MKLFSKLMSLALCVVLLCSLSACAGFGSQRTADSDREQLQAILNDLANNLHPGTAGSSLTSARLATDLLTWAATTKMDKKEAAAIVGEWLKEQSPEIRSHFQEKITSISDTYGRILKDGAADLLKSAGIESDFSNLGTRLKELVDAVLASGGVNK